MIAASSRVAAVAGLSHEDDIPSAQKAGMIHNQRATIKFYLFGAGTAIYRSTAGGGRMEVLATELFLNLALRCAER